jgi:nitrogen fixation/metabolism regulation signal transduction histidine kinase
MVPLGVETVALIGGVIVGEAFVSGVTEITGEPAILVPSGGEAREPSGGSEEAGGAGRITAEVPLGDAGWVLRVSAPSGDARQVRRDLREAFTGLAPLVLGSALLVGLILAEGISRPIRGLAVRAETISAERSRGPGPSRSLDEVRRLTRSFDRMLLALSESERQRLEAERVAAWQEVARRVAHEVRNPLSPIRMAVENLRRTRDKAPAELGRALEVESATILEEVDSLKRLVEEFSQFARLPPPQCAPCDLRAVVSQALALFSRRLSDLGVQAATSGLEQAHGVRADAEQIGRALKNVLANALDAMEGSAVKRLEIALRSLPSNPDIGQGAFEEIEVRDSGRGFDADALRRVFEPYFTTRGERGGSGLGMAIVYRIATDHGGSVAASGAAGQGAVITLRLPVDGPPADGPPGAEI